MLMTGGAATADGELNELGVRAAIVRASNDDRDAEGARPVDPFDRPALDEPLKVGSRKTADLCPDCGMVIALSRAKWPVPWSQPPGASSCASTRIRAA